MIIVHQGKLLRIVENRGRDHYRIKQESWVACPSFLINRGYLEIVNRHVNLTIQESRIEIEIFVPGTVIEARGYILVAKVVVCVREG